MMTDGLLVETVRLGQPQKWFGPLQITDRKMRAQIMNDQNKKQSNNEPKQSPRLSRVVYIFKLSEFQRANYVVREILDKHTREQKLSTNRMRS